MHGMRAPEGSRQKMLDILERLNMQDMDQQGGVFGARLGQGGEGEGEGIIKAYFFFFNS